MGIDKKGRPIYIEKSGAIDVDGVWSVIDEPSLLRAFMWSYETQSKLMINACSAMAGKQVAQTLTIIDMTGFGMGKLTALKGLLQKGSGIMQDNYPETLGNMYIINAPFIFTAAWAIVKNFVDEKTQKKI